MLNVEVDQSYHIISIPSKTIPAKNVVFTLSVSRENKLEARDPDGLAQFTATHTRYSSYRNITDF